MYGIFPAGEFSCNDSFCFTVSVVSIDKDMACDPVEDYALIHCQCVYPI